MAFLAPSVEGVFDLCRDWTFRFVVDNPTVLHKRSDGVGYRCEPAGKA
jgi:hypothetical protein